MIKITLGKKAYDYKKADLELVSSIESSIDLKDTPVSNKVLEYMNRIILTKKRDQFKNFIKPIGEMGFLQKLNLTEVFYAEDILFFKDIESMDNNHLSETQILCLKLQLDVLYQKIAYYKAFFIVINDDKSNNAIEQIKKQIDAEYNDIKNKDNKDKKIAQDLKALSSEFVVKNIQDTTKDGDELRPLSEKKIQYEAKLTAKQESMFNAINGIPAPAKK